MFAVRIIITLFDRHVSLCVIYAGNRCQVQSKNDNQAMMEELCEGNCRNHVFPSALFLVLGGE